MDVELLYQRIRQDLAAGQRPFCVVATVGTVGTVETGAIDALDELADLCEEQGIWLHVDGAYGAFGILDERVDSLATDQHNRLNKALAIELQRRGKTLLTSMRFQGKETLRACIVNYMTGPGDILTMVEEVIAAGAGGEHERCIAKKRYREDRTQITTLC